MNPYPGTAQHQALLHALVSYYVQDPRVRAVALFGSLERGAWDAYSDLDLDIVMADAIQLDVLQEIEQLSHSFTSVGEYLAIIIPDGEEAADVVLHSLQQLSIRYHPLKTTSPNIVGNLRLLSGTLEEATLKTAGEANRRPRAPALAPIRDRLIWYALDVDRALHRQHIWGAIEGLHRMRGSLMELFTRTRQGTRPVQFFQRAADAPLQIQLGATLPGYELTSVQGAFMRLLRLIQNDFPMWANGQIEFGEIHQHVFDLIQQRLAHLQFTSV